MCDERFDGGPGSGQTDVRLRERRARVQGGRYCEVETGSVGSGYRVKLGFPTVLSCATLTRRTGPSIAILWWLVGKSPPSKRCRKSMPAPLRRLATLLQATHACLTARAPHSRPATKSRHAAPSSATLSFDARMAHTPTHHAKASAALHTQAHTHTGTRATARPLTTPAHYQRKLRHRSRARAQKHANTVPKMCQCQQRARANNVPLRPAAWGNTPGGGKAPRFSPVRSRPALPGKGAARPATYASQPVSW